ncbi:MAG: tetratricopeptide repeat protein, partial [Bryobacteraceae bacterium]
LLMGGAALLAYAILQLPVFAIPRAAALLASAIFALHPAASSCVYPISSGRETLLPAVWMLGAVYAYLRGWRTVAMLTFAGALFSKEQAIMTPALFLLADLCGLAPDPPGRNVSAWIRRHWPGVPIVAIFFAIRLALFGGSEYVPGSLLGPVMAYLYALQTIFAPTVALVYEPTVTIWLSPVLMGIAVACLAAIVFLVRQQAPAPRSTVWFWLGWFLLVQLPTANLLRQEAHYDERYVFLASLGVIAIAARITRLPGASIAAVALIAVYASISFHRASYFQDDIAFSRQWIETNPGNVNAHYNLGFALAKQGRPEEAAAEYNEALRIRPDYAFAHCNLANALSALGRLDEAIPHYEEALRLNKNYEDARKNLGVAFGRKGRFDEAIEQFREVLRLNPNSAGAHNDIGNALAAKKQYPQASAEFLEALRLDPSLAEAHNNLGNVLVAQEKLPAAIAEYRRALQLRPDHEDARRNLALVEAHLSATQK